MLKYRWSICLVLLAVLGFGGYLYAQDQITLTTYYPAPYGHYAHLEVEQVAGVGDGVANIDGLEAGDAPGRILRVPIGSDTVQVVGNLNVSDEIKLATVTIHPPDIAEYIPARSCEAADVVIIDPTRDETVTRSIQPYDARVAGIISENPVLEIGNPNVGLPLALAGRVRVKATAINGSIARGDLLVTSSVPGHVMRADKDLIGPGMLVGKALETLPDGKGLILVLVQSR